MSEAAAWLQARIARSPESLRERMLNATVSSTSQPSVADTLAQAALSCLRNALAAPGERAGALDLLAADALLTHACEAAAQDGPDALIAFTGKWDTTRFQELLGSQ